MKNRYLALTLAVIPFGLGIHKFYLGNNLSGVMYLLFSWSGIPQVLSVIDVIRLATMDERKFNAVYNYHLLEPSSFQSSPRTVSTVSVPEERLDVVIVKTCSQKAVGATMSECVVATGASPQLVKETIEELCKQGFLVPDNRPGDYAVVYKSV